MLVGFCRGRLTCQLPLVLKPAEFAALARAIDAMKLVEVVLVKEGIDIVRMPVSLKQFTPWRDALPKWGSETRQQVNAGSICLGSDKKVN